MAILRFRFVIIFLAVAISTSAQTWADTLSRIEKLFARYAPDAPGAQLSVSRDGKLIFSKAWGMSDLEHAIPLTTTSITEAGSVSKQFTAAAILLLEQDGKLSLNDDIRKYIPELPDYKKVITIRQMMQHTSGLKDWGSIAAMSGWPRGTKAYDNDDALHVSTLQQSLNNSPGDEYIYSNSNYNLMAVIVKRVSGMELDVYTKKKIFDPAGMVNTQWRSNYKKIIPGRAIAYSRNAAGYFTNMPNENAYGNGGLLTTTEDLVKWVEYYQKGKLGGTALLEKQLMVNAFNNGIMHNYAAGLVIGSYKGWKRVSHDGATAGYRANLDYFPEKDLCIAWLSNSSEFDQSANIAAQVRDIFIGDKNTPATETVANKEYPATIVELQKFVGWYKNERTGAGIKITLQDGKISATQVGQLRPVAGKVLTVGTSANRFEYITVNGKTQFAFINALKDTVWLQRVEPAIITDAVLNEYIGRYYSEEAQGGFEVRIKNGELVLVQEAFREYKLTPTFKDAFDSPQGNIVFERNAHGKVSQFSISVARARNVAFIRTH